MKLRNLNGAVRKAADKVTVTMIAPDGRDIPIRVPRSMVVEGLKVAYGEEALTFETDLTVTEDGRLVSEITPTADHGVISIDDLLLSDADAFGLLDSDDVEDLLAD